MSLGSVENASCSLFYGSSLESLVCDRRGFRQELFGGFPPDAFGVAKDADVGCPHD